MKGWIILVIQKFCSLIVNTYSSVYLKVKIRKFRA